MRSYLHIAVQSPHIAIAEKKSTEQRHIRNLAFGRNPTLHNLVAVEFHLFAFLALASDLCNTDYLIAFAGGYHTEILRFLVGALSGILHFEFGMTFGADTTFKAVA